MLTVMPSFCAAASVSRSSTRNPARSARAHVPDHPPAGIEIGGDGEEPPPAPMLGRNVRHELRRRMLLDRALERPGVHQARAGRPILEDVAGRDGGKELVQLIVVA